MGIKLYRYAALVAALSYPAFGSDTKQSLEECAIINVDSARLLCFDLLTDRYEDAATTGNGDKQKNKSKGSWRVRESKSAIDDSETVTLMQDSKNEITGHLGRAQPTLIIRCKENKTEAFITWDTFVTIDGANVTTRVDKKKAVKLYWDGSSDHEATFSRGSIGLIKSMFGGSELVARVTPYGSGVAEASFDIEGIEEAIKPLRKACNW